MLFRIVIAAAFVAILFAGWQIFSRRAFYGDLAHTESFAVRQSEMEGNHSPLRIVEFLDYGCNACKTSHLLIMDYLSSVKDVALAVRPVPFAGEAESAALVAIAAGLQGKFWEMDDALSRYNGPVDEKFIRETSGIYGIDADKLLSDMKGNAVFKIAKDNAHAYMKAGLTKRPAFMVGKKLYQPNAPLTLNALVSMLQREKRTTN